MQELGFKVIEGYNLSALALDDRVMEFTSLLRAKKDGVGLFYFAGHGIEVGGVNYLIPSDIRVSNQKYIPYKSTPLNPIIEMMNETGKRLNIAILDACRENPFTSTRNNKRGGLASFSASGTFVAYSAESGKLAEDGSGNLSPFAESFIKELDRPQTIERLFKNVRTDVHTKTGGKQTPETKNLIMGDFYFKLPEESQDPSLHSGFRVERSQNIWRDPDTGYTWQKPIDNKEYNWREAVQYCEDLELGGYSDWRLPSRGELRTIMTENSYPNSKSYSGKTYIKKPLLETMTMKYQIFWTATKYNSDSSYSWVLSFNNGNDVSSNRSGSWYVLCLR